MNIPRNNPNGEKTYARNTQVSSMILAIFEALKNKPENKGKDEFQILKDFLDYYRIESDFGLLEEISKNGTVTFDIIKNDGFDIEKIIGDDRHTSASTLHNVLNSSNMGELGKDIEKIVIKKLVEKIKYKIPNELKSNFDREINNARTLNKFKNQLWNFIDYGDGGKAVNEEVYKEIKAIRIENKDIVDGLVKDGKIGTNDLDGNFKDWNASVSKKIDKLVTQEYLDEMKSGLEFLDKNFGLLKNTFNDFVPNMSWITKKYTYDENNVDEDILEQKNQAEEKGDSKKFNKLSFLAYIQSIGKNNKRLAEILKKLLENDFDFGKLNKEEQNDFLRDSVDARLGELKANNVNNIISVDQSDFDDFTKKLFDLNQNEIVINTAKGDIKLGINKKIKSGKNINWMDMSDINDAKIPLEFDIKVFDQDNDLLKNAAIRKVFGNEISEDGKSINLNTDNIGKLFLLYVLAQNSFDNILMNEENVEKLKDIFDDNKEGKEETKKDEDKKDGESENKGGTDIEKSSDSGTSIESKEKTSDQKFLEGRDNIRGYQFPESKGETFDGKEIGKGFEVGTRLWIKTGFDTELPPKDVGGDQWIQLKIIDINNDSFVVELEGGEKKAGDLEGKKFTYPKTKESLEKITNAFNGEVYKLTEPKDFRESVSNINSSSLSNLNGIGVFDEVEKKGGKLISNILEGNPEITHFGGIETKTGENDKVAETKDIINYEVKLNNNGTVDVSYGNYKRKMDYSNFIIFVSTKRLKPKTKEDVEIENKEIERTDVHRGSKLKFFSIKNIWNMVKGMGKKLDEGFKKYNEKQDKEFYNIAMGKRRIANKLQGLIGWVPGVGDALENMDTEYQNNLDKETWEKTEAILKKIEGHNDYGRAFGEKSYLNEILGAGVSLKDMVESGKLPGGLNSDKRFVASAVLLAQISKGPGPYHKLGEHRFKGIRVKLLLGEPYYSKFMKDQNEIIAEMKAKQGLYGPGYDAQLAAELARAEMTFLINNIGGRAPGQRLGNIGKGPTEDYAKKLRSDKFAGELETRFNDYMSRSKVEEGAGKLENVHNFTFAYGEYRRFLETGRPTKAIPFIKKMAQLAKSPDQIKILKGALLYGMLTGFFLHYALPSTQVWLQGICRSFGFSPGLWIPHIDSQKKTAHFLDVASGGDFFKSTKYKISDFDFGKEKINYKKLKEDGFENRWSSNSGKIDDFLTKDMYDEEMKDPIINQLKESALESQQEDIDQDVSKNSALIKNYPLLLTKGTINQISKYRDGQFEGKDVDEIQRSQDAWSAIAGAIPQSSIDTGRLLYITKRFLNRFDSSFDDKKHLTRIISTIKNYKDKTKSGNYKQVDKVEVKNSIGTKTLKEKFTGEISRDDVRNILIYAIKGKILEDGRNKGNPPPEFKKAIDAFENMIRNNMDKIDENFISQALGKDNLEYFGKDQSYVLAPWDFYQDLTEKFDGKLSDIDEVLKRDYKNKDDKYINIDMVKIKRNLKRAGGLPSLMQEGVDKISHPDLI